MGISADKAVRQDAVGPASATWSELPSIAADELLGPERAPTAISALLRRIAAAFGADCVIALHPSTALPLSAHAAQPAAAARDAALLSEIREQCARHGGTAAGPPEFFRGHVGSGLQRRNLLVSYSGPLRGTVRCALAVVGGMPDWPQDAVQALRACAAIIAGRMRQDEDGATRESLATALVAAAPDAIIVADASSRVREFNRAAEALFGWPRASVVGQRASDMLVPERHRSLFREANAAYLATGDRSAFDVRIRMPGLRSDGSEPVMEFTPMVIETDGQPFFCGFVHEAPDPAAAGASEARTDLRFGMLSELAPVAIVQADVSGYCTFVNGRWSKLTGVPAEQALGRTWLSSVHPDDALAVQAKLGVAMARGIELRADFRLAAVDGTQTWVHGAVRPVAGPDGVVTGHLAAFTNVDALKRAEAQLEAARHQLAEQNAALRDLDVARTQFLATVSHELRSPLTSIVSFTELLRDDADQLPPDAGEYLEIIQRNAERLLRLVSDLLDLDKLDEGVISLDLAPVRIPDIAADAVTFASASAAEAGIHLHLTRTDGPVIDGDRHRIQQILDNLISNAIKFSSRGSAVDVGTAWDGREWTLSVADSGIGIPDSEVGQLFDRFFRASNAVSGQVPGTGLGLATARAIAELHGGTIEVASAPGAGTTFTVRLPAAG